MLKTLNINSLSHTYQKTEVTGQTATHKVGGTDTVNHSLQSRDPWAETPVEIRTGTETWICHSRIAVDSGQRSES